MTGGRSRLAPHEAFFLVASLAAGLGYLLAFPPLSVADEPGHFYRAYAVSRGALTPDERAGMPGDVMPVSLTKLVPELRVGELVHLHPEWRIDRQRFREAASWPLRPDERTFVPFPTAAQYPFLAYALQAVGIGIGRLLELPAMQLVWAGRLTNLLGCTALTWLALRILPFGRWPMTLIVLTPMAASLRGSLSADAPTNALATLVVAAIAAIGWGEPRRWLWPLLLVASVALCSTKLPYPLLLLALAIVPRERLELRRRRSFWLALLLLCTLALGFSTWAAARFGANLRPRSGVDRNRQVADIVQEPLRFGGLVVRHYAEMGDRFVAQAVGAQLGWLDVQIPVPVLWAYLLVLLALFVWTGNPQVSIAAWRRLWLLGIGLVIAAAVAASQYAGWTPYRADDIEGVQGRYFLPVAALLPIVLHRAPRRPASDGAVLFGVAAFYALVSWVAIGRVVARHYG